jgi:hypothetical protein
MTEFCFTSDMLIWFESVRPLSSTALANSHADRPAGFDRCIVQQLANKYRLLLM